MLIGATLIYCIGLLALATLWALAGQRTWWLELTNTFALLLFAPLLLLLPAALLIRSRWMTGAIAAALALFVALFGARFMPPAARPAAGAPLRIMTFNQLFTNERIADVVASIRSQQADVIGLQELSEPVAEALKAELGSEYPYQALVPGNQSGLGLISRYPFQTSGSSTSVRGQRVTIQLDGQTVTILNVHLAAPYIRTRKILRLGVPVIIGYDAGSPTRQVGRLVGEVDQIAGPLVVIGDFNTGDREPRYTQLAARMHDAFRETNWGFGFTFPDHKRMGPLIFPFPLVRIDYVWSKGGVLPAAAHVECNNTGADHCFLVADLRVGAAAAVRR
jgi:endonuclease/exonuclease/phosphatase (EEP) superfamily protein YafD